MTTARLHRPRGLALAALAVALAVARPAAAQAPVAPAPETLVDTGAVVPASLAEEASAGQPAGPARLGPVPLVAGPAAPAGSSRGASGSDLGNWAILAALAAAFALLAAIRFQGRRRPVALPPDVFELLGEASLGGQQSVRVVRFGPRTLLVGVSAAGCHTLAELDDPQATGCIVAACRGLPARGRPPASTAVASPGLPQAVGRGAAGVTA